MNITTCIYCRGTSDEKPFDKEHVMPQHFGKFHNNFVLTCVCKECNNAFSRLERVSGQDSSEAILRLLKRIKPANKAHEVGQSRTVINLVGVSDWNGAQVKMADGGNDNIAASALPQVGFSRDKKQPEVWIPEADLTPEKVEPFRTGYYRHIVGPTQEDIDRVEAKLRELGLEITNSEPFEFPVADGEKIDVKSKILIDDTLLRVIGKIGFNYLAYNTSPDFVLSPDLDEIRTWLRYGTRSKDFVRPIDHRILYNETGYWRVTEGHLVTAHWLSTDTLIGEVSLFNGITYRILFCSRFRGIWRPVGVGHHFNYENRVITRLGAVNSTLIL